MFTLLAIVGFLVLLPLLFRLFLVCMLLLVFVLAFGGIIYGAMAAGAVVSGTALVLATVCLFVFAWFADKKSGAIA
jgi:hypothetical protein